MVEYDSSSPCLQTTRKFRDHKKTSTQNNLTYTHTGFYTTRPQSRTITNEIKARIAAKRADGRGATHLSSSCVDHPPPLKHTSLQPILRRLLLLHHELIRTEEPVVVTATILTHTSKRSNGKQREAHAVSMGVGSSG